MDPKYFQTAMFVRDTIRGGKIESILTGRCTVVVARSNVLCGHLRRCKGFHRIGSPSSHRLQATFDHSLGRHRPIDRRGPGVLVHVDPTVYSSLIFLE